MRVLFVCTGNSCRSPMAELYFDALCRKAGRHDLESGSAGICAYDGSPASRPSAAVMSELGIESSTFRSRRFSPSLAREYDLLIGMTDGHVEAMREIAPSEAVKLRLLLDYIRGGNVPDPYGGSVEEYRRVFQTMRPALDALFQDISKQV